MAVAPPAGAWIETQKIDISVLKIESLPPRERGLKHSKTCLKTRNAGVAPPAGAWIETDFLPKKLIFAFCRSPRGSVD